MSQPRNYIATSLLLLLLWCFMAASAWAAEVVGTVINLNGPLLARKADGSVKILAQKSQVHAGDTLVTENKVYARVRFIDDSEITLRPNTQFKIENFNFNPVRPENDDAKFNLVKGGLRAVTGVLGQRSKERVNYGTPTATIGIRGTTFVAEYVPESQSSAVAGYLFASVAALEAGEARTMSDAVLPVYPARPLQLAQGAPAPGGREPGLYVEVIDGVINLSNGGGSLDFSAGQFGHARSFDQPPVLLPVDPGIQFVPPPAFSSSSANQDGGGDGGNSDPDMVCEVR